MHSAAVSRIIPLRKSLDPTEMERLENSQWPDRVLESLAIVSKDIGKMGGQHELILSQLLQINGRLDRNDEKMAKIESQMATQTAIAPMVAESATRVAEDVRLLGGRMSAVEVWKHTVESSRRSNVAWVENLKWLMRLAIAGLSVYAAFFRH